MKVPPKRQWRAAASSGEPERAVDDSYATAWTAEAAERPWFEIDLGAVATLGGLEVYWGERAPANYRFASSLDGEAWSEFCRTRHGEGGQDVFAFPPVEARFVRWTSEDSPAERGPEIVEINLYAPEDAASVREAGRLAALGHAAVKVPAGESITVDFGAVRVAARRADRVGRGARNRVLDPSLRRRRDLSRDGPHRDRRRRNGQLLVALDDEPLFSLDRA